MNILIWTDLEGVSGIVDFDKHESFSKKDEFQRKLMTGEVNAAISMAIYLCMSERHDKESGKITAKKLSKRYSPWSSKIYTVQGGLNSRF